MATFEQVVHEHLVSCGMFPKQADEVLVLCKEDRDEMFASTRWDDTAEGYPAAILVVLCLSAKHYALKWTDENLPEAWFRPLAGALRVGMIDYDSLNEQIDRVEESLAQKRYGVNAEVPMSDGRKLGYGKRSGKWELYVVSRNDEEESTLRNSSTELRIEAARHLPALLAALKAENVRVAEEANEAINAYATFCDDLETS